MNRLLIGGVCMDERIVKSNSIVKLFHNYHKIITLDVETSGLNPINNQIIDIGLAEYIYENNMIQLKGSLSSLIKLNPNETLPEEIVKLTGITNEELQLHGIERSLAVEKVKHFLKTEKKTLIVAYNAQFDLSFLDHFLNEGSNTSAFILNHDYIDIMTIYKDRRPYPHRLFNAIDAYGLNGSVQNSHRALDDALASFEVFLSMGEEFDDIDKYVNLFGYNPKYGVNYSRFTCIQYKSQPYFAKVKLYQSNQ